MRNSYWYVYIIRCSDGTLYTGITIDLKKRLAEHNADDKNGARYTRSRRPVRLVYSEQAESRSAAARREHQLKKLPTKDKRQLVFSEDTNPDQKSQNTPLSL